MAVQGKAVAGDRWAHVTLQPGRLATGQGQGRNWGQTDELARAERLYEAVDHSGWTHQLVSFLTRQQQSLPILKGMARGASERQDVDCGLQEVPVERIVGTAQSSRSGEFDSQFCPLMPHLKERWLSVAMRCQAGRSLLPVELVLVDGCYYVVDGHHRVSVARALRLEAVDAYVTRLDLDMASHASSLKR